MHGSAGSSPERDAGDRKRGCALPSLLLDYVRYGGLTRTASTRSWRSSSSPGLWGTNHTEEVRARLDRADAASPTNGGDPAAAHDVAAGADSGHGELRGRAAPSAEGSLETQRQTVDHPNSQIVDVRLPYNEMTQTDSAIIVATACPIVASDLSSGFLS